MNNALTFAAAAIIAGAVLFGIYAFSSCTNVLGVVLCAFR